MSKHRTAPPVWVAGLEHTPLGPLACAATEAGLCAVALESAAEAGGRLGVAEGPPPQAVTALLQATLDQLAAYLQGARPVFDLPFDLRNCSTFQQQVLALVAGIPYGSMVTYGQIAAQAGGLRMSRAVGRAVGANPLPLVIPCHRVVAADGRMQGYSGRGGIRTKAWLLRLEGALLAAEEPA